MKKRLLLVLVSAVYFGNVTYSQTNFPNGIGGCIAHWDFALDKEVGNTFVTINDVSQNGNNGLPTTITSEPGFKNKPAQSGKFNGTTSLVRVPNAPILNPSNITVISLMKFNGFNSEKCQFNNIINKGRDQNFQMSWAFTVSDEAHDSDCFTFTPDKELLNFKTGNSDPTYYPEYTSNYIQLNKWYFLAAVYNLNSLKLYIVEFDEQVAPDFDNMQPLANVTMGTSLPTNNTDDIYIGFHENPPYPYRVNGSYDELVLYNRALSNTEIIDVAKHFYGPTGTSVKNVEESPINVYAFSKTIKISDPKNVFNSVAIFDVQGRKIATSVDKEITLSHLASQILFVRCYAKNGEVYYKKVMID